MTVSARPVGQLPGSEFVLPDSATSKMHQHHTELREDQDSTMLHEEAVDRHYLERRARFGVMLSRGRMRKTRAKTAKRYQVAQLGS